MVDYEKLYKILFNGITDAIHSMEKQNCDFAKVSLIKVQQEVENIYILTDDL